MKASTQGSRLRMERRSCLERGVELAIGRLSKVEGGRGGRGGGSVAAGDIYVHGVSLTKARMIHVS